MLQEVLAVTVYMLQEVLVVMACIQKESAKNPEEKFTLVEADDPRLYRRGITGIQGITGMLGATGVHRLSSALGFTGVQGPSGR